MKKYIIISAIFCFNTSLSMDNKLALSPQWHNGQWYKNSFPNIQACIFVLPQRVIENVKEKRGDYSLAFLARNFPQEVITHIFHKMLDDNQCSIAQYENVPIIDFFEDYQKAIESLGINSKKSIGLFLTLKSEQQRICSFPSQITTGNELIVTNGTFNSMRQYDKAIRQEFFQDVKIKAIPDRHFNRTQCNSPFIFKVRDFIQPIIIAGGIYYLTGGFSTKENGAVYVLIPWLNMLLRHLVFFLECLIAGKIIPYIYNAQDL